MTRLAPTFPPLLTGLRVDPPRDPFTEACRRARSGTLETGTVTWRCERQWARFAIALAPEVPLERAAGMVLLAAVACGDSLGALAPPQVAVTFDWPGAVRVNGGHVGAISAAIPERARAGAVPDWLVLSWALRLAHDPGEGEPGEHPDITALAEEGCAELQCGHLIGSICRHFLTWLNVWEDEGFRPVSDAWLFRATHPPGEAIGLDHGGRRLEGRVIGLDELGNLLLRPEAGETFALALADALERR